MDDQNNDNAADRQDDRQDDRQATVSTNRRTRSTVPTVYPEVDFVNRTLP